ncbi:MAG: hypothetical protein PUB19_00420 [Lachnospiraceae bacterium]|nr:hypothetical protein [Lachnospiraceae bacterium]
MENEVKKSASKVWLIPTIIAVVLLIGLVVFMVIMGKGTSALSDGTVTLAEAVSPLEDGTAQLSDGVDQYTDGVDQVADGIEQLNDAAPTLADGVQQLADGAVALNKGVNVGDKSLAAGMKSLAAGVESLDQTLQAGLTAEQQAAMVATVSATIQASFADPTNPTGTAAIEAAATQQLSAQLGGMLEAGKETAATGLLDNAAFSGVVSAGVQSIAVETQVKPGILATINQGISATGMSFASLDEVDAAWNTAIPALGGATLGTALSGSPTTTFNQFIDANVENVLANNAELKAGIASNINAVATGAADGIIDGIIEQVNAAGVPLLAKTISGATLQGALGAGQSVAVTVANQTMGTVRQGMVDGGLFEGVKALNAGVNGKDGLAEGVKKLQAGMDQLNENVPTLTDGIKQLFDGSQQLKENSQALRDGAAQLKDAAPALIDGIGQLVDGAKKVNGFTPIH